MTPLGRDAGWNAPALVDAKVSTERGTLQVWEDISVLAAGGGS
jgi:hypothetical protein